MARRRNPTEGVDIGLHANDHVPRRPPWRRKTGGSGRGAGPTGLLGHKHPSHRQPNARGHTDRVRDEAGHGTDVRWKDGRERFSPGVGIPGVTAQGKQRQRWEPRRRWLRKFWLGMPSCGASHHVPRNAEA
ncbi:unnamed protein product [Lampetra planeri]